MSTFLDTMDALGKRSTGVNGSDVYTQYDNALLTLFSTLNRDLKVDSLYEMLEMVLHQMGSKDTKNMESIADLFVLLYHTRDIREGKGERDLFYRMIDWIQQQPDLSQYLQRTIPLIPEYGCFVDIQKYMELYSESSLLDSLIQVYVDTLKKDRELLESRSTSGFSLAAKWAPREGKQYEETALRIARQLFPGLRKVETWREYRQLLGSLNRTLATTETFMCHDRAGAHHFSGIDPGRVPSRCLKKNRKAFLNETLKGEDLRYPDDQDRMTCREHFQEHVKRALAGDSSARVHGRTLYPHEFVTLIERSQCASEDERNTIQAQWQDLVHSIQERGTLGRIVVMCDFSGSMQGGHPVSPMDVSKGLGLLCAECAAPAFRNRILTFDSNPTWHILREDWTLWDRVRSFREVSQGTSTNFQAAVDLILLRMIETSLPQSEAPDTLLVITDMGFDQANGRGSNGTVWETHIERIRRDYQRSGYVAPNIVVWNVSGGFREFHSEDQSEGTCTISGWSANILKLLMEGGDIVAGMKEMTPMGMMRRVLDSDRYKAVRDALNASI